MSKRYKQHRRMRRRATHGHSKQFATWLVHNGALAMVGQTACWYAVRSKTSVWWFRVRDPL
jgi:hypothetical protein